MDLNCPKCGLPVATNEAAAYGGRHEDCHEMTCNAQVPGTNHQPSKGKQPASHHNAGGGKRVERKDFKN